MSISEHFAQVLEAGRTQFNVRFVEAKHRYPALDTADFSSFLQTTIDPVVAAVAPIAPERLTDVAIAAYDMGLELVGQGLAGPGARNELVNRIWQLVVPKYARLLAEHPYELLALLSNAAVNLLKIPDARTEMWLSGMADLSNITDSLSHLRSIGQIMAWRAGLAHYRKGAISVADQLPEALALAAVGAGENESWTVVRSNFLSDPWWSPAGEKSSSFNPDKKPIEIGQFSGFGGKFRLPPEVRATDEGFYIKSADQYFCLIADIYGAVLLPATVIEFNQSNLHHSSTHPHIQGANVILDKRKVALDLPVDGLSLSSNEHTFAISSPYTFLIQLFPLK